MSNVTISIDDKLLKQSREYAQERGLSLNALIRQFLIETVENQSTRWLDECFSLMDKTQADSKGEKWKRQDLYDA